MEVVESDVNEVKWKVARDNIVLEEKGNKQKGLRVFDFTLFGGFEEVRIRRLGRFPYLLMLIIM